MNDTAKKLQALSAAAEAVKKIENQTKETNFDWSLIFPEKKTLHLGWLISSIAVFMIICGAIIIFGVPGQNLYIALFAGGLLCAAWVSVCIHLRFDNKIISGGMAFALVVALLVVGRILTPYEGANKVLNQISDKTSNPEKNSVKPEKRPKSKPPDSGTAK